MPVAAPTVSASQLVSVIEGMRSLGIDVARLLGRAGIAPARLEGSARLPSELERRLWEEALALTGDRALGVRVARAIAPGGWGVFEYLVRSCDTLHSSLALAQRYGRLVDDLFTIDMERQGDEVRLQIGRMVPAPEAATECVYAGMVAEVRRIWPRAQPTSVSFAHARGVRSMAIYRDHFRCPVEFEAGLSAVSYPDAVLHAPREQLDARLTRVLEDHAARLLAEMPVTFLEQARQQLASLMDQPSAQALARCLGMSERTLRRRLDHEGTSYHALLDELRHAFALAQLATANSSLDVLAGRLGFRDLSTFHRAFKRWTGTTPARYRAQARS